MARTQKFERAKNRPKYCAISGNFRLWSRISPDRINIIKNRKSSWKSTTTPTLEEKKFVYFGPQTTEFIPVINLHPNVLFSGDYISALRRCCPSKFLHVLEINQGLPVHTHKGVEGALPPQKKNWSWKFKIWPKIQRVRLNNFRASRSILMKLFQSTWRQAGVINFVQFLEGPPPNI